MQPDPVSFLLPMPEARELKPPLSAVPLSILEKIAGLCGSAVAEGAVAYGGLSAAAGFVLTLQDGRKIFAKGNHPDEMSHGAENLRQEISFYTQANFAGRIAPRYIGAIDDGNEDGWRLGLWDYIAQQNPPEKIVDKMIAAVRETQAAFEQQADKRFLPRARDKNYIAQFFKPEKKFNRIRTEPDTRKKLLSVFADPAAGKKFIDENIDTLCAAQNRIADSAIDEALIHGDLRYDNFLFLQDRALIIDWPNVCRGPKVFDAVFLALNLEGLGVIRAEDFIARLYPDCDGAARDWMAASICGYFADQIYRAVPAKMPRLRWMQKIMFFAGLSMLSRAGMIDSPPDLR